LGDLRTAIALLEATLEAAHDGVVVLDRDRRVILHNRVFLEMFRLAPEQVLGRTSDQILGLIADQLTDIGSAMAIVQRGADDPSLEQLDRLRFKDGRVYQRFSAPQRVDGAIVGRVVSYEDVTAAVRVDEALTEQRGLLEKAQEVAHVGSFVAEIDGTDRLSWSPETYRIFGIRPDEFDGTSAAFFRFVHPDDLDAVVRAGETARSAGMPYDVEHRIMRPDGTIRWVHERADISRCPAGTPLRIVGTVQDITERRRLEEQLRQAQKLEAIGRLAGGIAHDINNALTAIVGYTELALAALAEGHPARPDVAEIRRAAERAESVTRQLLAFSRKQLLEPRVFHLSNAVANVTRFLERLLSGTIEVQAVTPAGLPPIHGDPGQIEQAIVNLAVNARDAMPAGGRLTLTVAVETVDEDGARVYQPMAPGRYVTLTVTDTGHGMDAETRAHVFEPFFTTKEVGKGTGLGLAMVYGTVKQSGGFIYVDSEVGRGTTFKLFFPPAKQVAAAPSASPAAPAEGRQPTVLVVEDEPAIRHLVVTALRNQGYRLLEAASGEEALVVADRETAGIDLLLTDANMPGISGIELANALVALAPALRVIVMSGYTQESLTVQGLRGAVSLLPKPFTPNDLRQKVSAVLSRSSPTASEG
jgi:PAS domain S-box-containing protein